LATKVEVLVEYDCLLHVQAYLLLAGFTVSFRFPGWGYGLLGGDYPLGVTLGSPLV